MAQGQYPEEYKPPVELDRSESEKSNLKPYLSVPRVSVSSAVYSPSSGRKFRANRGLTGLYSAVKGNTFNVIRGKELSIENMSGINQTVRGNILEEASPDMIDDSTVEAIVKAEIKNHSAKLTGF